MLIKKDNTYNYKHLSKQDTLNLSNENIYQQRRKRFVLFLNLYYKDILMSKLCVLS